MCKYQDYIIDKIFDMKSSLFLLLFFFFFVQTLDSRETAYLFHACITSSMIAHPQTGTLLVAINWFVNGTL